MLSTQLNGGPIAKYRPIGYDGEPVYKNAEAFISALNLSSSVGPKKTRSLAVPRISDDGLNIDWYVPFSPQSANGEYNIIAWHSASPLEKQQALAILSDLERSLKALGQELRMRGRADQSKLMTSYLTGQNSSQNLPAIHFPGPEFVYIVDGIPVITFWGFEEKSDDLSASPLDTLRRSSMSDYVAPSFASQDNSQASAFNQGPSPFTADTNNHSNFQGASFQGSSDNTMQQPNGSTTTINNYNQGRSRGGFPWWLLALLAILLLGLLLWFLLPWLFHLLGWAWPFDGDRVSVAEPVPAVQYVDNAQNPANPNAVPADGNVPLANNSVVPADGSSASAANLNSSTAPSTAAASEAFANATRQGIDPFAHSIYPATEQNAGQSTGQSTNPNDVVQNAAPNNGDSSAATGTSPNNNPSPASNNTANAASPVPAFHIPLPSVNLEGRFVGLDLNGDGRIDAVDINGDGLADGAARDNNLDGVVDAAVFDFNQDGFFEGMGLDLNSNSLLDSIGLDLNIDKVLDGLDMNGDGRPDVLFNTPDAALNGSNGQPAQGSGNAANGGANTSPYSQAYTVSSTTTYRVPANGGAFAVAANDSGTASAAAGSGTMPDSMGASTAGAEAAVGTGVGTGVGTSQAQGVYPDGAASGALGTMPDGSNGSSAAAAASDSTGNASTAPAPEGSALGQIYNDPTTASGVAMTGQGAGAQEPTAGNVGTAATASTASTEPTESNTGNAETPQPLLPPVDLDMDAINRQLAEEEAAAAAAAQAGNGQNPQAATQAGFNNQNSAALGNSNPTNPAENNGSNGTANNGENGQNPQTAAQAGFNNQNTAALGNSNPTNQAANDGNNGTAINGNNSQNPHTAAQNSFNTAAQNAARNTNASQTAAPNAAQNPAAQGALAANVANSNTDNAANAANVPEAITKIDPSRKLQFTPDSVKQQGIKVLNGQWNTRSGLMDSATSQPLRMAYTLNDGKGKVEIFRYDGSKCTGAVSAQSGKGGSVSIIALGRAVCPDGSTYSVPDVECQSMSGEVKCTGTDKNNSEPLSISLYGF